MHLVGEPSLGSLERALDAVAQGLEYLHGADRVHGDLRPENVVYYRGCRLADYPLQLGRRVPYPESALEIPHEGQYLAPEVWDHGMVDSSADVYSFGRLALRLLVSDERQISPRGSGWTRHIRADLTGRRRSVYEEVIAACLDINPRNRPTMTVVLDVLFQDARQSSQRLGALIRSPEVRSIALRRLSGSQWEISRPQDALGSAVELVLNDIARYPYLAVRRWTSSQAAQYIVSRALQLRGNFRYSEIGSRPKRKGSSVVKVPEQQPYQPPPDIDGDWIARIHRWYESSHLEDDDSELWENLPATERRLLQPSPREVIDWIAKQIDAANAVRRRVLAEPYFFTADVVQILRSTVLRASEETVGQLRRGGRLLALPDHGRLLYPGFQFEPSSGMPYPIIGDVSNLLEAAESPWAVAHWWLQPHPRLGMRAPREFLDTVEVDKIVLAAHHTLGRVEDVIEVPKPRPR
ncbi:MAG: protein kinase domain-containing protein [Frankiaceae bacterium]